MDLTVTWPPATARATLPHTSVEATTVAAPRMRPNHRLPQPVSTVEPIRQTAIAEQAAPSARRAIRCPIRRRSHAGFPLVRPSPADS